DPGGEQEALLVREHPLAAAGAGEDHHRARRHRQDAGGREGRRARVAGGEGGRERQRHAEPQRRQAPSGQVADGPDVDHERERWVGARSKSSGLKGCPGQLRRADGRRLLVLARTSTEKAMRSEKSKMLAGELYTADDPEIAADLRRTSQWLERYNAAAARPVEERHAMLGEIFAAVGEGAVIRPPFFCDYGSNISLGRGVFLNFNCVILDVVAVSMGDGTQIGPGVRSEEHTSELQSRENLVCRHLL